MCAGRAEGDVASCEGNGGGAAGVPSKGPLLVGVVSWGEECARKLRYGIYTYVSVYAGCCERYCARWKLIKLRAVRVGQIGALLCRRG